MWKIFSVILLSVLAASRPAPTPISVPKIPEGEVRVLKVALSHKEKLSPGQIITFNGSAKQIETRIHWEGQGADKYLVYTRAETLNNNCISKYVLTFFPGPELKMKNLDKTVTTPGGKVVQREYYDFSDPALKYPPILLHPFTLEIAFRSFEPTPGNRRAFNLWLNPMAVLKMEAVVGNTEEVTLSNGKKYKCYRIEMLPNIAEDFGVFADKLFRPLAPSYVFWLSAEGSHPLVKYSGPMGQVSFVNAPIETHEMVSYTAGEGG